VLVLACRASQAGEEDTLKQVVKGKVEEINNSLINEEFGKVVDLTHPKIVEQMGGRQKMIAVLEVGSKEMKSKGFQPCSIKVDTPSDPVKAGLDQYVVVPFLTEIKVPGGRLLQKASVVGVSGDRGKTWVFVNGDLGRKKIKEVLPNLPEQLKIPEKQRPVFEKD
jgi:hypothetical protein